MNKVIIDKIKKAIKKAESEKVLYFNFKNELEFKLQKYLDRDRRLNFFYYSKNEEEIKKSKKRIENIKKELEIKQKEIALNIEKLYNKNNISDKVFIKNKKLHFFNIIISANEESLILKDNKKIVNIEFDKMFSFKINENKLFITNEKIQLSMYLEGFEKYIDKEFSDIYLINNIKKYTKLFLEIIEIIIINKNIY